MDDFIFFEGAVNSPKGYYASGVACGIKKAGNLDLALVVSDPPAVSCGVFTRNIVKGHSLIRTIDLIGKSPARAIVINSGNANACVGIQGSRDADEMASVLAECLSCQPDNVLTASTGVIGKALPMSSVRSGIIKAVSSLSSETGSGHLAELAIMTTDLKPKESCIRFFSGEKPVIIAGMAKGSGMIHPDMATMISVITTDCCISQELLQNALKEVSDRSFNRISVDGDTSVCDMVVVLANGCADNPEIVSRESRDYRKFLKAMEIVCVDLAKAIAADGEGATKLIEIRVVNAASSGDALMVAQAVARSPLVKTAFFGEDANWGRILTAAGYSGAVFDPGKCDIYLGSLKAACDGNAVVFDESEAKAILKEHDITITIDLHSGIYNETMWTCDLSYDYVRINGSYRS